MVDRIFVQSDGRKSLSSFAYLNISQFLLTLNDSAYRLFVVFFLIDQFGEARSSEIIAVSALFFIVPFILLMIPAGCLSDRFSKSTIIKYSRFSEVFIIAFSIVVFYYKWEYTSYFILTLLAIEGAIFTPSKYGILPELVKPEELNKANSFFLLFLYGAIILGTFLGSFLTDITGRNFPLQAGICWIFALIGWLCTLKIEKTEAADPGKRIRFWFYGKMKESFQVAKKRRNLFIAMLAAPLFLFIGTYTQLNMIPFGLETLYISDVDSGYLFLSSAIGVGIGSLLVAGICGKTIELGLISIGGLGAGISVYILGVFVTDIPWAVFMLLLLGVSGAMFTIPVDAYIQLAAPKEKRGEIIAASSFLSFIGVFLAAVCLAVLGDWFKVSAGIGFAIVGLLGVLGTLTVTVFIPNYVFRFLFIQIGRIFCRIKVNMSPEIKPEQGYIYLCPPFNWKSYLSLIKPLPRVYFFLSKLPMGLQPFTLFFRLFNIIPSFKGQGEKEKKQVLKRLKEVIDRDCSICFFVHKDSIDLDVKDIVSLVEKKKEIGVVSVSIKVDPNKTDLPTHSLPWRNILHDVNLVMANPVHKDITSEKLQIYIEKTLERSVEN